jgi:glutathione S-transferase
MTRGGLFALLLVSTPAAAGFGVAVARSPALSSTLARSRALIGSESSAEEKLARIKQREQERLAAERRRPVPAGSRKSVGEKLRILFFGKGLVDAQHAASSAAAPYKLPAVNSEHPKPELPPGFTPPAPRPLRATGDILTLLSAVLAVCVRLAAGIFVVGWRPKLSFRAPGPAEYALQLGPLFLNDSSCVLRGEVARPQGRLVLYEFDSSPFCRKVRDAITQLDLTVEHRPCPGSGRAPPNAITEEHIELHGRGTVPCLIDEGKKVAMFESEEIVKYLYTTYGPGADKIPFTLKGAFALVSAGTAAIIRGMPADKLQIDARPDNHLMQPLTLYSYEGSPFCHPVREKLCALGLVHEVIPCGRGSANRAVLAQRTGRQFQVPHLVDPNTGVELSESIEIRMYLDRVYTTSGYTPLRGGSYLRDLRLAVQ